VYTITRTTRTQF